MEMNSPVSLLPGVGAAIKNRLKRLDIETIKDLLYHFPHRYEDFSHIVPIKDVKINEIVCIKGKIISIETTRTWKRKLVITEGIIQDETGAIKVLWFNQPYLEKSLRPDEIMVFAGKVSAGKRGAYLSNPSYEKFKDAEENIHTGRLVPVYSETIGLSSRWIRNLIVSAFMQVKNKTQETLPPEILKEYNFPKIDQALLRVHFPTSAKEAETAKERFIFEELFIIELFIFKEKIKLEKTSSPQIPTNLPVTRKFVNSLPFKLTDGQKKSAWQILKDMERSHPMNRLLEGDVGSGKTVVATIAALNVTKAGFQMAFMAPTEILAKQHFREVSRLLFPFKLRIALLTGKEDQISSVKLKNETIPISRQKILERAKNGEIDILIGTHALIQDKVKFQKLGLVIVDEQHRFGVEQRAKLTRQQTIPHLLSMTATPIPRTLALTIYGDLDLSIINELPEGRKKIITKIISPEERQEIYDFLRGQIAEGRQVFVICPRIESQKDKDKSKDFSGWAEVKAVTDEYEKLAKKIFPDLKIAMLHGKMKVGEKEKIMRDFKNQKTNILVSTSVIEVGIDVPNATVMVIEGAERFGLAQLHQFRGRVGRSVFQSYCFLFTSSPTLKTKQRLKAMVQAQNGFELSEKDLEIRGPGQFSGSKQWGIPDLAMAALKNIALVEKTREMAKEFLLKDFELKNSPVLRERLERFREKIHLE